MKREHKKLTLVKLTYSELKQKEISKTSKDFFDFIKSFGKNEKQKQLLVFGCLKIQYKK